MFISYAREDFQIASELYDRLSFHGHKPWMDKRDLIGGAKWEDVLISKIRSSDYFIFLSSKHSSLKRGMIQKEIRVAISQAEYMLNHDIYIIPIRLDESDVPDHFKKLQWIDIWDQEFEYRVLQSLAEKRVSASDASVSVSYKNQTQQLHNIVLSARIPRVKIPTDEDLEYQINSIIEGQIQKDMLSVKSIFRERIQDGFDFGEHYIYGSLSLLKYPLISIRFDVDHASGAHPVSDSYGLNVNLDQPSIIKFEDLFENPEAALDIIEPDLARYRVEDFIDSGEELLPHQQSGLLDDIHKTEARSMLLYEEQDRFVITENELLFFFGEFFGHAMGPVVVGVPKEKFKECSLTPLGADVIS